jgi:hypothetical protein
MFFTMVGMPNVIMCLVFLPVYPIYASSYWRKCYEGGTEVWSHKQDFDLSP